VVSGALVTSTNPLQMGGALAGPWGPYKFKGMLDEPGIYSRALSGSEISALYTAGGAGKCKVDTDGDGLTDLHENFLGTNPSNRDSDGDKVADGDEVFVYHTNPNSAADTDSDGIPDDWMVKYFGHPTGLESDHSRAQDDYDGDGATNLQEWQAGTDPNNIAFTVLASGEFVKPGPVPLDFSVEKGVPSFIAVLVDPHLDFMQTTQSPFSQASWVPFNSTATTNLSAEGRHEIWVGAKGRATDSEETWIAVPVTVDGTAPTVAITTPAESTLPGTLAQIRGTLTEDVDKLTYDLSNGAGTITDKEAFVVDMSAEPRIFQCFDVRLALGPNTITVHATDKAGNTTTFARTYTVDSSLDGTAPTVSLTSPPDGAVISGERFTVRGTTDDRSARVRLVIQDDQGPYEMEGFVDRDGNLRVVDVPVLGDNNVVTLTVTDDNNNSTSLSFTVHRSAVALAIDPVSAESAQNPTATVTGTVSRDDHTVTVNGIAAQITSFDGSLYHWVAYEVPVGSEGTATFTALATPPGGSPPSVRAEEVVDDPPEVELAYHYMRDERVTVDVIQPADVFFHFRTEDVNFTAGTGGTYLDDSYELHLAYGIPVGASEERWSAQLGPDGTGTLLLNGEPVYDNFSAPTRWQTADSKGYWTRTVPGMVSSWSVREHTGRTRFVLDTQGFRDKRDAGKKRPILLEPELNEVKLLGVDHFSNGDLPAWPNVCLLGDSVDGNGKRYKRLPTHTQIPFSVKRSEFCRSRWVELGRNGNSLPARHPEKVGLTYILHPMLADSQALTRDWLQGLFDAGADALARDDDPYPLGWLSEAAVTPSPGDPYPLVYFSDDVPAYTEFDIREGRLTQDKHYDGGRGPFFPCSCPPEETSESCLQLLKFRDPSCGVPPLDNDTAFLCSCADANIKIVNRINSGETRGSSGNPNRVQGPLAPTMVLPLNIDAVIVIHEWGHTRGLFHRNELWQGTTPNPGPDRDCYMARIDLWQKPRMNWNERGSLPQ